MSFTVSTARSCAALDAGTRFGLMAEALTRLNRA